MGCQTCNHDNRSERRFCAECGTALAIVEAVTRLGEEEAPALLSDPQTANRVTANRLSVRVGKHTGGIGSSSCRRTDRAWR
jgi:hypothetical protein